MPKLSVSVFVTGAILAIALAAGAQSVPAISKGSEAGRLQRLEDTEAIRALLDAYGSTLDRHDYTAFEHLFTADASYGMGKPVVGNKAIAASLKKVMAQNPSHLPGPGFHLFFNQTIDVRGDTATATSKGAYAVPSADGQRAQIVFLVTYDDTLVRQDGHWLFQRRVIRPGIPHPRATP